MLIVEIILALLIRGGDVAMCTVDWIGWRATRFTCTDELDFGVDCVLLTNHYDTHASMLPTSEIGFKFT